MVSRKLLEATGCTDARLREIFTAEADASTPNGKIRKSFEDRIRSRTLEGMQACLKNAHRWQAVDVGWDSTPVQPQTIPLLLYAQGKIKLDDCVTELEKSELGKQCVVRGKNDDGRDTIKIDMPRLYEVSINLIRSYVTRRHATQTARFSHLWPFLKYEPRGTDDVAKLRGDALSQRIEAMTDAYGYRHLCSQSYRHIFLYSRAMIFPRAAWDVKTGWRLKEANTETPKGEDPELESFVDREGVDLALVHPSRYYYDRSAPLANINYDTGPSWLGYWDIVRFSAIKSGNYFNLTQVGTSEAQSGIITANGQYFAYYFDPKVLKMPEPCHGRDPAMDNDRRQGVGFYASEDGDKGVIVNQYFERVNPHAAGIGKLNMDVWMRLSAAGDGTIIAAEFLPTTIPAMYGGVNENDDRLINASMAMELMQFQDQLTNIFSQMLMNLRTSMFQVWAIDQDLLDKTMRDYIEETIKAGKYYTEPQAWFYSGSKLNETGAQSPRALLQVIQANASQTITESMNAAAQVLNMADRVLVLSNNEAGQPNPREVSAREVTEISTTTNAIASFTSDGVDEQRCALKRFLYDSLIGMGTQEFRVPVMGRYLKQTIEDAGFKVEGDSPDDNAVLPMKTPITGRLKDLEYDYYFDSRDGADRPVNSQAAGVLSQLMGQIMQVPMIAQAVGKRRLFEILNEIFRQCGAGFDLKLSLDDGEDEEMPDQQQPAAGQPAAPGAGQQGSGAPPAMVMQMEQQIGNLKQVVMGLVQQLQAAGVLQGTGDPGGGAQPGPTVGASPAELTPV